MDGLFEGSRLDMPAEALEETQEAAPVESAEPKESTEADGGTENVQAPAEVKEEKPSEPVAEVPATYTDEEYEALQLEARDVTRMTPLQRSQYQKEKNLEAGYQKKYQALADERRQLEQAKAAPVLSQEQQIEEKYFREYLTDPDSVTGKINARIREIRKEDPYSENIDILTEFKEKLERRRTDVIAQATQQRIEHERVREFQVMAAQEVKTIIPEYTPELARELSKYAVEKLGYTQEELVEMTSLRNPKLAAKNVKIFIDKYNADKGIKKVVEQKKAPTSVEGAGSGFDTEQRPTDSYSTSIAERQRRVLR